MYLGSYNSKDKDKKMLLLQMSYKLIASETSIPSDVVFEHYNHDYAMLQHFHIDHIITGLRDVGSTAE